MRKLIILLVMVCIVVIACENQDDARLFASKNIPKRQLDSSVVTLGKLVFEKNCVRCHGQNAEGNPNWRTPKSNGNYPPPPLNGSGHAWHHSREVLGNIILNGSLNGAGDMPPMQDVLSDQEVEAVVTWLQSIWSEKVYAAWYTLQQKQ